MTCGKRLLIQWIQEETMTLLNDSQTTWADSSSKKESILDLALVSKNIQQYIKSFKVDKDKSITPFSLKGLFSDHKAITVELKIPITEREKDNKKEEVINYKNKEGWRKYPEISEKYAESLEKLINEVEDVDILENKIISLDSEMQKECFGTIWIDHNKKKKRKKRKKDKKSEKEMVSAQLDDIDNLREKGFFKKKDMNQKMYMLKEMVTGPKIKRQEPLAINDPISKELITDKNKIKEKYLEHNVKILTKKEPEKEYEAELKKKKETHERIMSEHIENVWELDKHIFKKVLDKIKKKGKQVYLLLTKAGPKYKEAIFKYMKKLIIKEEVPLCFKNTSLTPIWKRKGSALDLNNMRFVHMRSWRSKLLEALVVEKMKDKIVEATPKFQIGGMPKSQSCENLVILKTWMKMKEQKGETGIFQVFDMEKFFDKESLLDCMYTLHTKAKIDNKSYRMWYKLNEDTRISVKTSVGQSRSKKIKDTIGQGSSGAALVSSLNIGCAMEEAFKGQTSTKIGEVEINSEILQDDIANLNDNMGIARKACKNINQALARKQLSINYNKSKFIIIGSKNKKKREKILNEAKVNPLKMGNSIIENSEEEKYLGDKVNENGCEASITETIKERIRNLTSKGHDIIQISESPLMGGLGNSTAPFKLFDATIAESLLTNCASWIGLTENHINTLQNFQDGFIRSALKLADSIPKALLTWDIGLMPMKWRIEQKKLIFLNQLMKRDISNLAKQVVMEEVLTGIHGLAYECGQICDEIGIPDIMCFETTEQAIKDAIWN